MTRETSSNEIKGMSLQQYEGVKDDLFRLFPNAKVGEIWNAAAQIKGLVSNIPQNAEIFLTSVPPPYVDSVDYIVEFGRKFLFFTYRVYVRIKIPVNPTVVP